MSMILLFLVQLLCMTETKEDEGGGECRRDKLVKVDKGPSFALISRVDPWARCYVLFQPNDGSLRCCYGSTAKCGDLEHTKDGRCQDHNINVNSTANSTCNLTIQSVSKADAGFYRFFDTDGRSLTKCHMVVIESEETHWKMASSAMLAIMVLFVLLWLMSRKRALIKSAKFNNEAFNKRRPFTLEQECKPSHSDAESCKISSRRQTEERDTTTMTL